jgi:hypothetical protein
VTPQEKRRRFRDLAKHVPVKTARQIEAQRSQLEFDFTPSARKPARQLRQSGHNPSALTRTRNTT